MLAIPFLYIICVIFDNGSTKMCLQNASKYCCASAFLSLFMLPLCVPNVWFGMTHTTCDFAWRGKRGEDDSMPWR